MNCGIKIILLFSCAFLLMLHNSFAQTDSNSVRPTTKITLRDGSEIVGSIISEDSLVITFKTPTNISMVIPKNQIKFMEKLSGEMANGEYVRVDPNTTRLFFAPTGRTLPAGMGYFSDYELFFPFIGIGITDYITLAGGMSLAPGATEQLLYFAPKIRFIQLDNFDASGGVLYINSTSFSSDAVGIVYGVGTVKLPRADITGGIGWGFSKGDLSNKPIIMLGGEFSVSGSMKFITENWFPVGADVSIISFGIRFYGERLAADLAFMRPLNGWSSGFPFFPWVGFAYNFGPLVSATGK